MSLYRQYVYAPDNTATCIPDKVEDYHETPVPKSGCKCGFWALDDARLVIEKHCTTPKGGPPEAIGLVSGFGRFVEHTDNTYRFERMRVIAIGATPHFAASVFSQHVDQIERDRERLHNLSESCRALDVPLYYDRSIDFVLGELAIAAGRYTG